MSRHAYFYSETAEAVGVNAGTCMVHEGVHRFQNDPEPCYGWVDAGRHARRPETMLVYIHERRAGYASGEVIRGEGDDAVEGTFWVEDNEPDDVWGPILSRIAEDFGLSGSPEHCDGGEVRGHHITDVVAVLELRHDGTPS